MSDLNWLFATSAVKIAPANLQFWYTSGLIGPYYINTHFLCGGEEQAIAVLNLIDEQAADIKNFPTIITQKLNEVYNKHIIFRELIDELAKRVGKLVKQENITYISGGQRRDWFFAPIIADKLGLPCLYIYNDLKIFDQAGQAVTSIQGAKVINIADLLTAGSSYTEKWLPAIEAINGKLVASANIVDRSQGGQANLEAAGINHNISIFTIDLGFFKLALEQNYINPAQHQILCSYFNNQDQSMRDWLIANPNFLEDALGSPDPKIQNRAKTLIEKNLYSLNDHISH